MIGSRFSKLIRITNSTDTLKTHIIVPKNGSLTIDCLNCRLSVFPTDNIVYNYADRLCKNLDIKFNAKEMERLYYISYYPAFSLKNKDINGRFVYTGDKAFIQFSSEKEYDPMLITGFTGDFFKSRNVYYRMI